MQTILITGGTPAQKDLEILSLMDRFKISPFNQLRLKEDGSISIDTIRAIKHSLVTKSFNEGNRAIIIHNFDKATPQAQNAFLKTLEEPPANTYIILLAQSSNALLPTVLSRVRRIRLISKIETPDQKDFADLVKQISRGKLAEKILLSETVGKNREEIKEFLTLCIAELRKELLFVYISNQNKPAPYSPHFLIQSIRKCSKALDFLTYNVNPRLTLEILLFGIKEGN